MSEEVDIGALQAQMEEMKVKNKALETMNDKLINYTNQPPPPPPQRQAPPEQWEVMGMSEEQWKGYSDETQVMMGYSVTANQALRDEMTQALTSGFNQMRNDMNPQADAITKKMEELQKNKNFKNFSQEALRLVAVDKLEGEKETNDEEDNSAYPGGVGSRGIPTPKTKVKLTKDSPEGKELYAGLMEATGNDEDEANKAFEIRQSLINGDK